MLYLNNENTDAEPDELMDMDDNQLDDQPFPESLPILPLRNTVLFPGVVIPITVARDKSIQLVKDAYSKKGKLIGCVAQKNSEIENPTAADLYSTGTVAAILRLIRMPEGSVTIVIQGRNRFKIDAVQQEEPYFKASVSKLEDSKHPADQTKAMILSLKQDGERFIEMSPNIPSEANITLHNINSLGMVTHFIASNLPIEVPLKQDILEKSDLLQKAQLTLQCLAKELQVLELSEQIHSKVKTDMDKQQRDYILRQQIKAIHDELGEQSVENEIEELKTKGKEKKWSQATYELFQKELHKLYKLNSASPEYGVAYNYVQWLLDLPWQHYSKDKINLYTANKVLNQHHYGLEKVKQRILEYLAVIKLKGNMKAPILCFYGPPGVGKTSLGRSIAKALNREFVRVSLGGVRDEAEIRGHRRTYIGSMPGRILQALKKAKTGNPVFVLDEIDKVGNDFRGDPSSALLEVLDPEQNFAFNDHYLELDYDLSTTLFIATANTLDNIHPALKDRMELIEINGYTLEEKIEIAKKHLIPKNVEDHGLVHERIIIPKNIISILIDGYTRESGVRALTQQIANLCRGVAKEIVSDERIAAIIIDPERVEKYLGVPRFEKEIYQKTEKPGVAIGLAWTAVGGEILFIETVLSRGSGKLSLTGQLGDVMKESATVAYIYLKANAEKYNIPLTAFEKWDVHIHIPAGATPKDGPSAGVTLLAAIASAFTQRLIQPALAMSGEITLRGKVLPVGGIKEKVLAATRAGIKTIALPKPNQKDISEIKPEHIKNLTIHYIEQMDDILNLALTKKTIPNPLKLDYDNPKNIPTPHYA